MNKTLKKGSTYYALESTYSYTHEDYKGMIDGVPYMLINEGGATVSVPVVLVKSFRFQTEFFLKDKPVNSEHYEEMLGILPPERYCAGAFLVGEAVRHDKEDGRYVPVYDLYFEADGKYYNGGVASVRSFESFCVPVLSDNNL